MLNNLLSLFASNLEAGLFTFILGRLIVFLGMGIIVLVISVIGKVMTAVNGKPAEKKKEPAPAISAPAAPAPKAASVSDGEISVEVVAAITAAVACVLQAENSSCEFVVRKIKKI